MPTSIWRAITWRSRGRPRRHVSTIAAALARPGDPWMRWRYALHVHEMRGQIDLARGAPDAALAAAEAELQGAQRHRVVKVEARALTLRGAALLALERRDEAEASLAASVALAERIGHLRGAWHAHALLAELARRAGRTAVAAGRVRPPNAPPHRWPMPICASV
jgi:hypothetical protein